MSASTVEPYGGTILNGTERQNSPTSDMIFSAQRLVSHISRDMTLLPGDLIACGTSVGVGARRAVGFVLELSASRKSPRFCMIAMP
jgi:2-keto-4-pentenoate hydratase/2-oxohepta-3-ene-1,7-dioic acid hydratase in catechol pathway